MKNSLQKSFNITSSNFYKGKKAINTDICFKHLFHYPQYLFLNISLI